MRAFVARARADLLICDRLQGVRRYRESDGAYLGPAGAGGELKYGLALGPDGNVYLAAEDLTGQPSPLLSGEILRFNGVTGAPMGALVPFGQNGLTYSPIGLAFTSGSVFAWGTTTSPALNGVLRWSATTGALIGLAVPAGADGLGNATNVWTMPNGDLLVADQTRINRYDKNTLALVSTFVAPGSGGLTQIADAKFGPDGNFYVSNYASSGQIARFNGTTGAFIDAFVPSINYPDGFTFGLDGQLYITRGVPFSRTVDRYNGTTGAFMSTFINDPSENYAGLAITVPPVPEPASLAIIGMIALTSMTLKRRRWWSSRPRR